MSGKIDVPRFWECDGCGHVCESDPVCGDDWGGEMRAVGPDCPYCEYEMDCFDADSLGGECGCDGCEAKKGKR